MRAINAELRIAGEWLACGTPVEAVRRCSPCLWARTLLCANSALVVVVVNQRCRGTAEAFTCGPVVDAHLQVALPGWLEGKAELVTAEGLAPLRPDRRDDVIDLELDGVADAAIVVIR